MWSKLVYTPSACQHVQWAAYLTASARINLHDRLRIAGKHAVYCDTDSVFSERDLAPASWLGDDLGQWKSEGEYLRFEALAPKLYRFDGGGEKLTIKAKGFSRLDQSGWDRIVNGKPWVLDSGVEGWKTAARRGGRLFVRRTLTRSVIGRDGFVGGRVVLPDGCTMPVQAERLDEIDGREDSDE